MLNKQEEKSILNRIFFSTDELDDLANPLKSIHMMLEMSELSTKRCISLSKQEQKMLP